MLWDVVVGWLVSWLVVSRAYNIIYFGGGEGLIECTVWVCCQVTGLVRVLSGSC